MRRYSPLATGSRPDRPGVPQTALIVTSEVSQGARAIHAALKRRGYAAEWATLEEIASGRKTGDVLIDRSLPPYDLPIASWTGRWWNRPDRAWNAWSKSFIALAARQRDIPHPMTVAFEPLAEKTDPQSQYVSAAERAKAIWNLLSAQGAVVVKPDRGMEGRGIVLAQSADEMQAAMASLRFGVAQEYIPEAASTLRVVCTRNGVFASCERVAQAGDWRANYAQGATIKRHPVKTDDEIGALARESVRALNLDMAGVDIIRTPTGLMVLEVNPAFGWPPVLADMYPDGLDKLVGALGLPSCSCGDELPHDASTCA